MAVVLAKDAFLVFRALCKLSIRTADATTHTDLTALRGKARRPKLYDGRLGALLALVCCTLEAHQQCS